MAIVACRSHLFNDSAHILQIFLTLVSFFFFFSSHSFDTAWVVVSNYFICFTAMCMFCFYTSTLYLQLVCSIECMQNSPYSQNSIGTKFSRAPIFRSQITYLSRKLYFVVYLRNQCNMDNINNLDNV